MPQSAALKVARSGGSESHPMQFVTNVMELLEVAHASFE